jgi:hypothetical protein
MSIRHPYSTNKKHFSRKLSHYLLATKDVRRRVCLCCFLCVWYSSCCGYDEFAPNDSACIQRTMAEGFIMIRGLSTFWMCSYFLAYKHLRSKAADELAIACQEAFLVRHGVNLTLFSTIVWPARAKNPFFKFWSTRCCTWFDKSVSDGIFSQLPRGKGARQQNQIQYDASKL